ncbi:zinc finger protein 761-like [Armigeres subalbatus]|uniref:zinc finger protein 761-like n=1 Tax=Armigeres subalbatus TaxID=124917 RepID=UPI002ED3BDFC
MNSLTNSKTVFIICRLCLTVRKRSERIFDGDNKLLPQWIEELTSLKITFTPNAPASLCLECKSNLEDFATFREMCISNDRLFYETFITKAVPDVDNVEDQGAELIVPDVPDVGATNKVASHIVSVQKEMANQVGHNNDSMNLNDVGKADLQVQANKKTIAVRERQKRKFCKICKKKVSQLHLKLHQIDGTFKCSECPKIFARYIAAYTHYMKVHSKSATYKCKLCQKAFIYPQCLQTHILSHVENNTFSCSQCNEQFTHAYLLKRHHQVEHTIRTYLCNICPATFDHPSKLRTHVNKKHCTVSTALKNVKRTKLSGSYACDQCDATFALSSSVVRHKRDAHHDEHYCTHCELEFSSEEQLAIHKQSEEHLQRSNSFVIAEDSNSENNTETEPISSTQRLDSDRTQDEQTVAVGEIKIEIPEIRGVTAPIDFVNSPTDTSNVQKLQKRIKINSKGGKSIVKQEDEDGRSLKFCSFCATETTPMHVLAHQGEHVFRCNRCTASCDSYDNLMKHLRSHKKTDKFVCQLCRSSFKLRKHFVKHQLMHTKLSNAVTNAYPCTKCEKQFANCQSLKLHTKRVHKEVFVCDVCGEKFRRRSKLAAHLKLVKVHDPKCRKCRLIFPTKEQLEIHTRFMHPELVDSSVEQQPNKQSPIEEFTEKKLNIHSV